MTMASQGTVLYRQVGVDASPVVERCWEGLLSLSFWALAEPQHRAASI